MRSNSTVKANDLDLNEGKDCKHGIKFNGLNETCDTYDKNNRRSLILLQEAR